MLRANHKHFGEYFVFTEVKLRELATKNKIERGREKLEKDRNHNKPIIHSVLCVFEYKKRSDKSDEKILK